MDIFTLLKSNIMHKRGVFTSIVILMFIITLALTTILSTSRNIRVSLNREMESTDSGDIMASFDDSNLTNVMRDSIKADPNVERFREIPSFTAMDVVINEKPEVSFLLFQSDKNEISYKVFQDNDRAIIENPPRLNKGEIYVPICFKSLYNCKIGSKISFTSNRGKETFQIKGFIQEPMLGAYVIDTKLVFLSDEDFEDIVNSINSFNSSVDDGYQRIHKIEVMHIYQSKESTLTIPELKRELNNTCGFVDYACSSLSKEDSMEYTTMFTDIFSGILITFVILLIAIMMIVMGHSISTGIEMDYVNLGILKAIGFTKVRIRWILVLQYLLAEFSGAVLGLLASIPCVKMLGSVFQPITGIIAVNDLDVWKCTVFIFALFFISTVFVYVKTVNVAHISPVNAINGGHLSIYFDSRLRTSLGQKALLLRLAFRQLTTGAKQYIGLTVIAAILIYFMMAVTTLANCMTTKSLQENYGAIISDITLKLNDKFKAEDMEDVEKSINDLVPVTQSIFTTSDYFTLDGYEYYGKCYDKPEELKSMIKGRIPLYDNEIVVTEIVAGELNKKIGDSVVIRKGEKSEEYLISGYFQTTNDAGRCFSMSLDAAKKLGLGNPQRGYITLEDQAKMDDINQMLNEKYGNILEAGKTQDEGSLVDLIQNSLNVVSAIIYIISGLFALVVVHMVCNKTFLKEKRDLGISKAIGFTNASLRLQFAIRFFIVAFIGSILGSVLFFIFNNKVMSMLLYSMGIYNYITEYKIGTIFLPVLFICICFLFFSYLAIGKVKKLSVREFVME